MIGMVLVTHGGLAREFLAAVEHVVGPQEAVSVVCIGPEDDPDERRQQIIDGVARVDGGEGVIVVTDMFGGTPSNLALSVLEQGRVEVVAGMNLPMLIKLTELRGSQPIARVVAEARDSGRKYINVASELLAGGAAKKSGK